MSTKQFSFGKNEKLCSSKIIERLFNEGKSFVKYPFRITILPLPSEDFKAPQVLISVSKRKFKRAYKRNLLKRRFREAYRLNKHTLHEALARTSSNLAIAFIYLPNETLEFSDIEKGLKKGLNQIIHKFMKDE